MIVRCGVNGETLDDRQIFVCHHCGMPVCEDHGWVVAADDAFADTVTIPAQRSAAPRNAPPALAEAARRAAAAASALRSAGAVPRPAMHCRDCVERHHRNAVKRHGWAESRPATNIPAQAGRR